MKSYLLDTSSIIHYLQGKKEVVALLDSLDGEVSSSTVCLAELYEGVYRVKNPAEVEKVIRRFFQTLSHVYAIDEKIAKQFGEIRARLKIKGAIIEDIDIFIAATCLVYDSTLVTSNRKHFSHVPGLKVFEDL